MTDKLTDAEKIAQLWGRLDQAESEKASLQFLNEQKDQKITALRAQVDGLSLQIHTLRQQVADALTEVNSARIAASTAVQDYISSRG